MDRSAPAPWNPDRAWADPFIAILVLLVVLVVSFASRARHTQPPPPPSQVELQGRLADVALAAPKVLGGLTGSAIAPKDSLRSLVDRNLKGWDRAVLAVHASADGDAALGADLAKDAPGEVGEAFRAALAWAYQGTGTAPGPEALRKVGRALGDGYAAGVLEARCLARSGGDAKALERRAADWVLPRLAGFVAAGLLSLGLILGGLAFMLYLALSRARPAPLPAYAMPVRAALIVLLGWFLTHLAASYVVAILVSALPFLKSVALPIAYGLHALLGTGYLCLAEGIPFRSLWRRLAPGAHARALATGLGFLALAFTVVVAVAMALSPLLRGAEPPQRELMELLSRLSRPLPLVAMFLTVAVVAPVFEELLFRGFMLPWLGQRLEPRLGRRGGWALAVAVTGLTFGAMHMQPLGLPTLATLGIVLGFAYLRTGNLLTAILVHGLWNGGIFIAMRLLA